MSETDDVKSISSGATSLAKANNHLAIELMKLLCEEANVFFSPFSLSTALAILYVGAKSETSEEMRCALGYQAANISDDDIVNSYRSLMMDLEKNPDHYVLSSANSILNQKDFSVKEEYKSMASENFRALLLDVDFRSDSQKVVSQINSWVKDKTRNMIPQLLDSLDPATVMVLLNAVYFKGMWLHQFDPRSTFEHRFYNNGMEENMKNVDMMHVNENFLYAEQETFKALQLNYKGEEMAMIILLPHATNGVKELGNNLSSSFIQELKKCMRRRKVDVALPKFRMEYSKSLKSDFQSLGMKKVFDVGADLDGISDNKQLLVSEIFHKAVLEVNEEGSEAAAATAVMIMCRSAPRNYSFIVDHPFMFAIYDIRNGLILFMGKVEEL